MPKERHPFHAEPTNDTRRNLARLTLAYYLKTRGEAPDEGTSDILDLVTDLLHLAASMMPSDREPEQILETAAMHYRAERN